ncbi:hypothetical protein Btru_008827 [Bulinus truncatus]|nr:hypothetical protein Btru_008827 [Bulinus truncatus]
MASQERQDLLVTDISFDLERLFDPYNFDHIPEEKRLDQFKQRDLAHIKHYKAAVKIFGGPQMRTRVIIAPPMETPFKHRLGYYINKPLNPPPVILNGKLKSPQQTSKELSEEEKKKVTEVEKRENYKQWMLKRRKIREDLANLSQYEEFLKRKLNKSEIEKQVQARFRASRLWKPDQPPPAEVIPPPKPLPDIPIVAVPPPEGLQILDKFLSLNRMRLMDLFLLADKEKSWLVSRDNFLNLVSKAEIPLSESEVDDLMITLDTNGDNKLDYQELNQGLIQWRKQRRDLKKQELLKNSSFSSEETETKLKTKDTHFSESSVYAKERSSSESHFQHLPNNLQSSSIPQPIINVPITVVEPIKDTDEQIKSPISSRPGSNFMMQQIKSPNSSRPGSRITSSRSYTSGSNSLEVPELDLREEARVPESTEAMLDNRKHSKVVLNRNNMKRNLSPVERLTFDEIPGVIKIGYKPIDDHCSESTLGGESADKVNKFRQEKLKEYHAVKKMLIEQGLPFTQDTLDKVLLYPGDRPTRSIQDDLRISHGSDSPRWGSSNKTLEKKKIRHTDTGIKLSAHNSSLKFTEEFTRDGQSLTRSKESGKDRSSFHYEKSLRKRHKYHRIEEAYPLASTVKIKGEEMELSSGTAVIKSKLNNWMTFEEYSKYTKNFQNRYLHRKRRSNPHADWTGYLLDKLYLYMDHDYSGKGHPIKNMDSSAYSGVGVGMYNGRGNAVFHETHQMKRAYHGYNNDLLTWPVGQNGVRYGSIDEHRIIR